jgi:hypothetical protein
MAKVLVSDETMGTGRAATAADRDIVQAWASADWQSRSSHGHVVRAADGDTVGRCCPEHPASVAATP